MTTFVFDLREAARLCTHPEYQDVLKRAAEDLAYATELFHGRGDAESMTLLNGAWAYAVRVMKAKPDEADPNPPLAGAPEPAKLAA
jgi:hypothetical protein